MRGLSISNKSVNGVLERVHLNGTAHSHRYKLLRGFTIVELLVVIVVIAILAAITIVAYNGIQQRAQYSKLSAGLNSYEKASQLYKVDHGVFPHTDGYQSGCLGRPEDYPATADFQQGQCGLTGGAMGSINNDINTALAPYLTPVPDLGGLPIITYSDGSKYRGVYYEGNDTYFYYEYGMPNGSTCPYGKDTWSGDEVLCDWAIQ
jgi:prepilin-type N-terminal cleavage/methylation domain-containing protein